MPALAQGALAGATSSISAHRECSKMDAFQNLVDELSRTLGPSSGLTSEEVDVELLKRAMERYNSEQSEWGKYAFVDLSRGYTRNLVDRGNGKSNLVRRSEPSIDGEEHRLIDIGTADSGLDAGEGQPNP